jgi:hypothetical protein
MSTESKYVLAGASAKIGARQIADDLVANFGTGIP